MRYLDASRTVIVRDDGAFVPVDPSNTDYQAILASGVQIAPYAKYATLADAKAARLRDLAGRRWKATQFFTFDGVRTQADGAIGAITAKLVYRQMFNVTDAETWQLSETEFRQFDTAALIGFGGAVNNHIQGCFNNQEALAAQIRAATTIADVEAVDIEQGWP